MRSDELWHLVQKSTALTNSQMCDMIPLIKSNFWKWSTYQGCVMQQIADRLQITQGVANDIYDKVNLILNGAKAAGVREIY